MDRFRPEMENQSCTFSKTKYISGAIDVRRSSTRRSRIALFYVSMMILSNVIAQNVNGENVVQGPYGKRHTRLLTLFFFQGQTTLLTQDILPSPRRHRVDMLLGWCGLFSPSEYGASGRRFHGLCRRGFHISLDLFIFLLLQTRDASGEERKRPSGRKGWWCLPSHEFDDVKLANISSSSQNETGLTPAL